MPNSAPKHSDRHRAALERQVDRQRVRVGWYNTKRWRVSRGVYLRHNPLCARCAEADRTEQATLVDHVIPHRGDYTLFWDMDNWQALCTPCHNFKTGKGQ